MGAFFKLDHATILATFRCATILHDECRARMAELVRRRGLKIPRPQGHVGSIPTLGIVVGFRVADKTEPVSTAVENAYAALVCEYDRRPRPRFRTPGHSFTLGW